MRYWYLPACRTLLFNDNITDGGWRAYVTEQG